MTASLSTAPASVATVPEHAIELEELFAAQRANRWAVARTTAAERKAKLLRLKQAILAHRQQLYQAFQADFGKPQVEVEMLEVQPVLGELDHVVAQLERWMRPRPASTPLLLFHARSEVRYEPRGLVLILGPWNYPFQLLFSPLIPAIAAGNCVIMRPSEKVPNVARVMGEIVSAAFPANEVALVAGEVDVADALLHMPFDHFFFTGSGTVGRKVMKAAAEHLASVTLELGGKSPAIIDASADVAQTAERLVWGKFINAGQTCVAPDYVLVHESRRDAFLDAAKRVLNQFYGSNEAARVRSGDLTQIIDERAFTRLHGVVEAAIAAGARAEVGGQADRERRKIAPTILSNVAPNNPIMAEEIFGPILPVLTFRTLDEAIALINSKDKPLALYMFSQDQAAVERVLQETTAGGTVVNNTIVHLGNPGLPFGGIGASGSGNYHGEYGFRAFSHERAVLRQSRLSFGSLFYPPYSRGRMRLALLNERVMYRVLPALKRAFGL